MNCVKVFRDDADAGIERVAVLDGTTHWTGIQLRDDKSGYLVTFALVNGQEFQYTCKLEEDVFTMCCNDTAGLISAFLISREDEHPPTCDPYDTDRTCIVTLKPYQTFYKVVLEHTTIVGVYASNPVESFHEFIRMHVVRRDEE